ncbi:mitochondrial antiviral-signaling protein isoform X1 [Lissotriton helveticus]
MGFAEDKMWDYVRKHLSDFHSITVVDILDHLAGFLTTADMEGIRARLGNHGNQRSTYDFLDALRRRTNWVNGLISALRACEHGDLAERLQVEYDALQPSSGSPSTNNSNQFSNVGAASPQPSSLPHSINTPPSYSSLPPTFAPIRLIQQPSASPLNTSSATSLPSQQTPERATSMTEPPPSYYSLPDRNSTTAANPPGYLSQPPTDDTLTECKAPIPETQPERRPSSTSSTQANDNAAMGIAPQVASGYAAAYPGVEAVVPSLTPRSPKKGGFESRLSQNSSLDRNTNEGSGDGASNFALPPESAPVRDRAAAFEPDPEPAVRRKETGLPKKRTPVERPDDHMGKVTDNVSHRLSTNPNEATPKSKNTFGGAGRSQIPRKVIHLQTSDPQNTPSPAETRGKNPPKRIETPSNASTNKRDERQETRSEVNRDSNEEEEEHPSKPGVLYSQVRTDQNPASGEESVTSSLHESRLALSESTYGTSRGTTSSRQPPAAEDPRRLHAPFNQHAPDSSSSDSSSSMFTIRSDPIMVSANSCETESLHSKVNEPEEDDYSSPTSAMGRSTGMEERVSRSRSNVAANSTHPVDASETFDDGDMRDYQLHFVNNPTVDNLSANNAVGLSPSEGPNSRSNVDEEKDNIALAHVVLPAIMFALVGIFLLYKTRQKQ